jgi:hypothetical protein
VWWLPGGDGKDGVTVLQVEAVKHVEDLTRLGNGLADVTEIVRESSTWCNNQ